MSEQDPNQLKKNPAGTPAPEGAPPEDAGTQALSEALRSSFIIVRIIMVGLVVAFFGSGFFSVDAQHKAIILRMGRPVGEGEAALLGPGLHFAFPKPIDEVVPMTYTASQTANSSVGWFQTPAERAKNLTPAAPQNRLDPATISYVLTSDTNILHVVASVTYRITDPIKFNFDFANAPRLVTNDLNNALLFAASGFSVDDILTGRQAEFRDQVLKRMKQLVNEQDLGITIEIVSPQASAPLALLKDFQRVADVSQEGAHSVSSAYSYKSTVLGNAQATGEKRIQVARAAVTSMVGAIGAEQTNFSMLLPYYRENPELVKSLLMAGTVRRALNKSALTEVVPDTEGSQFRIHLGPPVSAIGSTNQTSQ
jgi:modulator of FtsH protease HflK